MVDSDNDLIRRCDALAEVELYRKDWADARDAIAALPTVTPMVKPLVWLDDGPRWPDSFYAVSAIGRYEVGPYKKDLFSCYVDPEMRDVGLNFRTPDAAKAAAQADYEARILAALDMQPAPDAQAILEDALREAATVAQGYHERALEWAKKVRGLERYIGETDSSRIATAILALIGTTAEGGA